MQIHTRLAMTAISLDVKVAIYIVFNAYWAPLQFNLPLPPQNINGNWHRIVDTALPSPLDIIPLGNPLPEIQGHYLVAPRSACLFVCGGFATEPLTVGGINSVVEPRR